MSITSLPRCYREPIYLVCLAKVPVRAELVEVRVQRDKVVHGRLIVALRTSTGSVRTD